MKKIAIGIIAIGMFTGIDILDAKGQSKQTQVDENQSFLEKLREKSKSQKENSASNQLFAKNKSDTKELAKLKKNIQSTSKKMKKVRDQLTKFVANAKSFNSQTTSVYLLEIIRYVFFVSDDVIESFELTINLFADALKDISKGKGKKADAAMVQFDLNKRLIAEIFAAKYVTYQHWLGLFLLFTNALKQEKRRLSNATNVKTVCQQILPEQQKLSKSIRACSDYIKGMMKTDDEEMLLISQGMGMFFQMVETLIEFVNLLISFAGGRDAGGLVSFGNKTKKTKGEYMKKAAEACEIVMGKMESSTKSK